MELKGKIDGGIRLQHSATSHGGNRGNEWNDGGRRDEKRRENSEMEFGARLKGL